MIRKDTNNVRYNNNIMILCDTIRFAFNTWVRWRKLEDFHVFCAIEIRFGCF